MKPTVGAPALGIEAIAAETDERIAFAFRTDAVLRELSFPESFGLIFIATEDGSVLYQEAPSKRTWLRHLRWGEQQFRDSGAGHYGSLKLEKLMTCSATTDDGVAAPGVDERTDLAAAGRAVSRGLPRAARARERLQLNLVLGGAVPTEVLVRQALAVDSYFLAALVFLLLLALLGFPFVKLLSLDARERFTLRDVTLLYLSTAALLALFTFATQAVDGYVRWHRVADQGLKELAERLERDFINEVGVIRDQIDRLRRAGRGHDRRRLEERAPSTDWYGSVESGRRARAWPLPDDRCTSSRCPGSGRPAGRSGRSPRTPSPPRTTSRRASTFSRFATAILPSEAKDRQPSQR